MKASVLVAAMMGFFLLVAALLLFAPSAKAEQSAAMLVSGATERNWNSDGPFTIGFAFRVNSPIVITAVGVYDSFDDGLIKSHNLALWTIDGSQLFSATVPAGTLSPLVDRFRYVATGDWMLEPNMDYVIAAANFGMNSDHYLATAPVPQSSDLITLFSSRDLYTPLIGLAYPTTIKPYDSPIEFGANFRFVAVPEPTGLGLGICAAALLALSNGLRWHDRKGTASNFINLTRPTFHRKTRPAAC